MSDLRERLRSYGYPAYEPFCKTSNDALEALEAKDQRIEQLEAALRWEAGEECLHAFDGVDCINKHGPESPDLWCTYCRIIWVLGEKE